MIHTVLLDFVVGGPLPENVHDLIVVRSTPHRVDDRKGELPFRQVFAVALVLRVLLGLEVGKIVADLEVQTQQVTQRGEVAVSKKGGVGKSW